MHRIALESAKLALRKLPLKSLGSGLVGNITYYLKEPTTPILIYHATGSNEDRSEVMSRNIHDVNEKSFKRQLQVLKSNYEVVFVDEILRRIKKGKPVDGFAAVTFDDGYKSVLKNALPILKKLNIPATWYLSTKLITEKSFWRDKIRFIINTGRVGDFLAWLSKKGIKPSGLGEEEFYWESKDPDTVSSKLMEETTNRFLHNVVDKDIPFDGIYIDKKDLNRIDSDLLRIGNHTHSHYVLSSLNKKEQRGEVKRAKKILQKYDVEKSNILSIPFGGSHTFDRDTVDACSELDYEGVLTSSGQNISSATDGHNYQNNRLPKLVRFMPTNNNPWFLVHNKC